MSRERLIEAAAKALWRPHPDGPSDGQLEVTNRVLDAILSSLAENELLRSDGRLVRAEPALPDCSYPGGHLFVDESRCFECGADQYPSNLYRLIPVSEKGEEG